MKQHLGKRLYITGIPTSGKSYLAKKLAQDVGGVAVSLDYHRDEMKKDVELSKWVNFYWNIDEKNYFSTTTDGDQWKNLVSQSKALWPAFLEKINSYTEETKPIIFECVNMLPHIVTPDISFPGIMLVGESFESTLERNMKDPRWGNTKELQEMEAKYFFYIERPRYINEAQTFNLPVFEKADDAYETAIKILS